MYPSVNEMPTPIGKLDELLDSGDSSAKPFKVFIGHNLGNRSFMMMMPMRDFYSISEVANERGKDGSPVAQRPLNIEHATKLAVYILKGLVFAAQLRRNIQKKMESSALNQITKILGTQPYLSLQPIVANLRNCAAGGVNISGERMMSEQKETACFKVYLSQKDILWVVDGQHRRKAMDLVFKFLDEVRMTQKYSKKGSLYPHKGNLLVTNDELEAWNECNEVARSVCTVLVEAHLGLDVDQERQLFHDLNNLAKKVEASLALKFDTSNPVNAFIKETIIDEIFGWNEAKDKDVVDWHQDDGVWTYKDLVAVNSLLFLNKTNISGAKPQDVNDKVDIANRFWQSVKSIPYFGQQGAKIKTVAAQPVVVKALAKITFDYAFGRRKPDNSNELVDKLLNGILSFDFSHDNPIWRYYEMTNEERNHHNLNGLKDYLPSDDEGYNRDIGKYDETAKWMRFGAKHNDILPIIGDMIRWSLGLPKRGKIEKPEN